MILPGNVAWPSIPDTLNISNCYDINAGADEPPEFGKFGNLTEKGSRIAVGLKLT